jgi:arylsulfatase A-like enzyme
VDVVHSLFETGKKSRIGSWGRIKHGAEIVDIGARWGLLVAIIAAVGDATSIAFNQSTPVAVLLRSFLVSAFSLTLPMMIGGAGLAFFIGLVAGFKPLRPQITALAQTDAAPRILLKALALAFLIVVPVALLHDDMTLWFLTRFPKRESAAKVLLLSEYGLLLASLIVGWVLWKLLDWPIGRLNSAMVPKFTNGKRSFFTAATLFVFLLAGMVVLLTRMVVEFEDIELLSMAAISALGVISLLVIGGRMLLRAHPLTKKRHLVRAAGYGIALLLLILGPGMSRNSLAQAALTNYGPVFRTISPIYIQLGDPDKDRYSSIMGGRDTVPFDPWAFPAAPEIPGNGIDDNCLLGDPSSDYVPKRDAHFVELPDRWRDKDFNILLVTIDTVRADHMSFNGYPRETTPYLNELTKESVNFSRAYAQGTGTILSTPSYMSGRYISQMQCANLQHEPDLRRPYPNIEFLPDYLRRHGYYTSMFSVCNYLEFFSELDWDLYSNTKDLHANKIVVTSPEITERVVKKMKDVLPKYKTFAWVHYYDPHDEYVRHHGEKSFGSSKIDLYDGELHFTDKYIGRLIDEWKRMSPLPTVLIVSADHGESMGEHGIPYHNMNFYDSIVRVPLIIQIPGEAPGHIDDPVGLLDIVPTLRNLLGDDPDPNEFGRSLLGEIFNKTTDPDRMIFHEATFRQFRKLWSKRGISGKRYKFMWDMIGGAEELYDIQNDPEELDNLIADLPEEADRMRQSLYSFIEDVSVTAPPFNNCNYWTPSSFTRYFPPLRDESMVNPYILDELPADKPSNTDVVFGVDSNLKLVRYEVTPESVMDDRRVTVRLYFESIKRVESDHLIFVHARGASGGLRKYSFNYDHWPVQNLLPLGDWPLGKIVVDEFILTIPSGMGGGKVDFYFGFWDKKTKKRLKVVSHPKEIKVDGSRVHLATVEALDRPISAKTIESIRQTSATDKD